MQNKSNIENTIVILCVYRVYIIKLDYGHIEGTEKFSIY